MPEPLREPLLALVALGARERTRELLKRTIPRRRGRLTLVRTARELSASLKQEFADAVIVDLGQPGEEQWAAAALARDFPSLPFFALAPARPAELPALARACLELECADLLVEGVDDAVLREVILSKTFSARFAHALRGAAPRLGLESQLQGDVWSFVVSHGGRTVRTESIAAAVGLTREHLSRRFSASGAPNLKRVIDFARLLGAAELAKNPGFDLPDIARVLGFSSASHLGSSGLRVLGVRPASLARLRPEELIERFVRQGRSRSRS